MADITAPRLAIAANSHWKGPAILVGLWIVLVAATGLFSSIAASL